MAENSKIEWCDHTFNPWVGCTKVAPPCDFCYAQAWAKRTGHPALWQGERRRTKTWQEPIKWSKQAVGIIPGKLALSRRPRVFCASLADVFDNQVPTRWRDDLWFLIEATRELDWLLLTKRPQNIGKMLPDPRTGIRPWGDGWPNVWLGATCGDQAEYDRNWDALRRVPATINFISYEPALGPLLPGLDDHEGETPDWIIAGGESGGNARPAHPDWFRRLRDDCQQLGIAFLFKQWGEHAPVNNDLHPRAIYVAPDGQKVEEGDPGYRSSEVMARVGKKAAGRLLDGREWNEFPRTPANTESSR